MFKLLETFELSAEKMRKWEDETETTWTKGTSWVIVKLWISSHILGAIKKREMSLAFHELVVYV